MKTLQVNDLISYHLEGSTEVKYLNISDHFLEIDAPIITDEVPSFENREIIRGYGMVKTHYDVLSREKCSTFYKNIIDNFGQIHITDFINQNPEYFI